MYNQNDIILAFIILAIALLLIAWRVEVIMSYPDTLDTGSQEIAEETATVDDAGEDTAASSQASAASSGETTSDLWKDGKLKKDVTVTVESGSVTAAVESLVTAGLFESYAEFAAYCEGNDIDPTTIKTGEFTFKKDTSKEGIARLVTE